MNISQLPFEDIVNIIEKLDYKSIINLSQTSSEFREIIYGNNTLKKLVSDKLDENTAGKLIYNFEESEEMFIFLRDELSRKIYTIYWSLDEDVENLQRLINIIENNNYDFSELTFGEGQLYAIQDDYIEYLDLNSNFSVELNRDLFLRLLKEYEKLKRDGTSGEVRVRNDRSVDLILT